MVCDEDAVHVADTSLETILGCKEREGADIVDGVPVLEEGGSNEIVILSFEALEYTMVPLDEIS